MNTGTTREWLESFTLEDGFADPAAGRMNFDLYSVCARDASDPMATVKVPTPRRRKRTPQPLTRQATPKASS